MAGPDSPHQGRPGDHNSDRTACFLEAVKYHTYTSLPTPPPKIMENRILPGPVTQDHLKDQEEAKSSSQMAQATLLINMNVGNGCLRGIHVALHTCPSASLEMSFSRKLAWHWNSYPAIFVGVACSIHVPIQLLETMVADGWSLQAAYWPPSLNKHRGQRGSLKVTERWNKRQGIGWRPLGFSTKM